jgi:hypothetical protein
MTRRPIPQSAATEQELNDQSNRSLIDVSCNTSGDSEQYGDPQTAPKQKPIPFHPVEHFYHHLTEGFFCTHESHNQAFEKHCDDLQELEDTHDNCIDLRDLAINTDPTLQRNNFIPNFVSKKYFLRGDKVLTSPKYTVKSFPDLTSKASFIPAPNRRQLYEGKFDDLSKPGRVCMFNHEFQATQQAPSELPDVDSACGEVDSFGAFKRGWLYYPHTIPIMSGKCHGVRIKIVDTLAPKGYWMVPPEEVPHILIGKLSSWGYITIYMLFPQLWLHRRQFKDSSPYLTTSERQSLYEDVFFPSFSSAIPENERADIPSTFSMAVSEAEAAAYEQGRQQHRAGSRLQMLHQAIQPRFSHAFTLACHENIRNGHLDNFSDFRIFFVAKGMKDSERQLTYSDLHRKWNLKWNAEFDQRYISHQKYWVDLGRQFAPNSHDEDPPSQLLWKPCCLKTYWQSRSKPFGHTRTLNFQQYHLGHCRDIISTTITAAADSVQYHQGCCHSAFYGKHKEHFVTNTISVFESKDIDILAHSEALVAAVSREGRASTASIPNAAVHLVHGLARAENAINQLATQAGQAREEHRIRGDIFQKLLNRLVKNEEENTHIPLNNYPTHDEDESSLSLSEAVITTPYQRQMMEATSLLNEQHTEDPGHTHRHLPFWNVPSNVFASFLRGNLNKACMGFEVVLRDINTSHVNHETTATALIFLSLMRHSTLSKDPVTAPELYRNQWKSAPKAKADDTALNDRDSSSEEIEEILHEGMGMKENMNEFGYGYFKSKIDWNSWHIPPESAVNFFRNEPMFVQSMRAKRKQVLHVWEWHSVLGMIRQWFTEAKTAEERETVLDFTASYIMLTYRHAVWAQLKDNSVLDHLTREVQDMLVDGRVPVTFSNIARFVKDTDPAVPRQPDLTNSNHNFHKGDPMNVLEYLFGWNDYFDPKGKKKKREHWNTKMFRIVYKEVYMLFAENLSPHQMRLWKRQLFLMIHATNPLLPNPDGTQFISRKKNSMGYAWLAYDWIEGLGPFSAPLSCRELLNTLCPYGAEAALLNTQWCNSKSGRFFDGTPPRLRFEEEFLGKSIPRMKNVMEKKWRKLKQSR